MVIDLHIMSLVAVGLIALVALLYYRDVAQKKQAESLRRVAAELGLYFSPEGDAALQSSLSGFPLFSQGHSRRLSGLLQGTARGVTVAIFDYSYVTMSGGRNDRLLRQTVICFGLPPSTGMVKMCTSSCTVIAKAI